MLNELNPGLLEIHESDDPEMMAMVEWVRSRIRLKGFASDMWSEEDHNQTCLEFLAHGDSRRMIAYITEDKELQLIHVYRTAPVLPNQYMYFIRKDATPLTPKVSVYLLPVSLFPIH